MLVSGGKLLAIDKVNTDDFTVSGDGVEQVLSVNTDIIATNTVVDSVSSILQSDIQAVSSNFDNYYTKSETSGSEQLAEEFDSIKSSIQNYDLVSLTPDNLYAGISADSQNKNVYVVSATDAQDKLEFDGVYDPETNKVATVETVNNAVKTVKPIILEYNKTVDYTWEELQNIAPNVYATTDGSALFNLAVVNENEMIFRQHAAAKIGSDEHSQIHVTELQLFRNLNWNTEAITYDVSDPWSDNGTGINVSTGRISVNVDDSTIKINESNQLYAVDNFQHVSYEVTQWADIDFSKTLILDAALQSNSVSTSLYEKSDILIRWLAIADNKIYYVDLSSDNTWKLTEVELGGEKYTAGEGLKLIQNEFSVDTDEIASTDTVSSVSAKLSTDINDVLTKFSNYYLKSETSGKDELANEFTKYQKLGDYVTSSTEQISDVDKAYVLVNSENTITWSGVDLTNVGKTYDISGNGVSAWKTDDTYLISASIVGDNNVTAKYDSSENTWHIGLSAENCAYLFGGYVNAEPVSENTILKLDSNNKNKIEIDQDGYITLPDSTNKFTFCINEYIDDNSSDDHNYLLNKLVLSAKDNDSIVVSQNYYPSEVGASNITIATTIDNTAASDRKYCIVYKGSTVDTNKLHINASVIEEVMSYDSIAGKIDDYTGINPIYVVDDSRRIGLGWDENVFTLTDADELGRRKLTIEAGGQTVDTDKFEKIVNVIDTRMTETFPIGLVKDENALSNQLSYLFRPAMSYDMTSATSAYIYHGNTSTDVSATIGVYDVTTTPYTLAWQSEVTTMPVTQGGQTIFKASSDTSRTVMTTIRPDGLYYATIRVSPSKSIVNALGIYANLGANVGTPMPVAMLSNYGSDMNLPMTADAKSIGTLESGMHKAYIGFRGVLNNA